VWLALFLAWIPVVTALILHSASPTVTVVVGTAVGSVSLLATLIYGGLLGRNGRWGEIVLATIAGTAGLMACFVALTVTAPDPSNTNDIAAGAGVATFGLPTFVVVAILLSLGGGIGRLTKSLGQDRTHPEAAAR
jgi:hypothetical protein